jgi:disulfide bond formation protein DsbB
MIDKPVALARHEADSTGAPTDPTLWGFVFAAWLVAAVSSLGALFLGEVMGFAPCVLCWYQRIFMFPLVFVLAVGLFPLDARVVRYAFPLAAVGWLVAAYHVLLVAGIIPESATPCMQGVPCGQVQVEWFGFVTIPLLSTLSFTVINLILLAITLRNRP